MAPQIKTLGDIKKVAHMFGSEAENWVDIKIQQSPQGEDEPVVASDTQVMFLLIELAERGQAMSGKPI